MIQQILFVQGGGEAGTHDAWDNKLVDSLGAKLGDRYAVNYPLMPDEANPDYPRWSKAIGDAIAALGEGVILCGHSIGATILIAYLAKERTPRKPSAVFLIAAPFLGEGGWPSEEDIPAMDDLGERLPKGMPVYLYHGDADDTAPIAHLDLYAKAIPQAAARRLKGRDHQLNDDLSEVARDIARLVASSAALSGGKDRA